MATMSGMRVGAAMVVSGAALPTTEVVNLVMNSLLGTVRGLMVMPGLAWWNCSSTTSKPACTNSAMKPCQ